MQFQQDNEFISQGISNPDVLTLFTPLANSKIDTASNGLIVVGTAIEVKPGRGDYSRCKRSIAQTYQVGNLTTLPGSPVSVVGILVNQTLATSNQTITGAINELKSNVASIPPAQLIRTADNTATVTLDVGVGGANPASSNQGLSLLNGGITNRNSIVEAINSIFTQKMPFSSAMCTS